MLWDSALGKGGRYDLDGWVMNGVYFYDSHGWVLGLVIWLRDGRRGFMTRRTWCLSLGWKNGLESFFFFGLDLECVLVVAHSFTMQI